MVASETSTLTFISVPGLGYQGNLHFLQLALGYFAGRCLVALLFIPAYYRGELETAYDFIGKRFGLPLRRLTSSVFILTRVLASGVRLFASAIPLHLITGLSYPASILLIGSRSSPAGWPAFGAAGARAWVEGVLRSLSGHFELVRIEGGVPESRARTSIRPGALNSAVECHLHTVEVTGSNPVAPTTPFVPKHFRRRPCCLPVSARLVAECGGGSAGRFSRRLILL